METRRLVIRKDDLLLYISIILFIARDCIRVILGRFVYTASGWSFERYTGFVMTALAFLSMLLLLLYVLTSSRQRLPNRLQIAILIISLVTIFWTFHSFFTVPGYRFMTLDGTAKTVWICLFGIAIGYNKRSWLNVKKFVPFLAFLYMSLTFLFIIYIRANGMWRQQSNEAPYWFTYSTAIWLFAYYALCFEIKNRRQNNLLLVLMLMNISVVAFTISRGWLLQSIFLIVVYLFLSKGTSHRYKVRLILLLSVILAVGVYFLRDEIAIYITSYITKFETATSRSSQYDVFFSQVRPSQLITGLGEYASYTYRDNANYIYFDNSYIYYAFHFGSLFAVVMFLLPFKEGILTLRMRHIDRDGNIGFILLMWIAALNGLSVFCAGYEVSFRVLFMMILIGRAAYINDSAKFLYVQSVEDEG